MPATPESPHRPLTLLAFDYGRRRIGVAVGQQVTGSAGPVGTTSNREDGPNWEQLANWIRDWQPDRLLVGMPYHADGSDSEMTVEVRAFAADLEQFGLPVDAVDERYSSVDAEAGLKAARAGGRRRRVRKEAIDAAAAVLIAERWLTANSVDHQVHDNDV